MHTIELEILRPQLADANQFVEQFRTELAVKECALAEATKAVSQLLAVQRELGMTQAALEERERALAEVAATATKAARVGELEIEMEKLWKALSDAQRVMGQMRS